jgi:hypothetical protein
VTHWFLERSPPVAPVPPPKIVEPEPAAKPAGQKR